MRRLVDALNARRSWSSATTAAAAAARPATRGSLLLQTWRWCWLTSASAAGRTSAAAPTMQRLRRRWRSNSMRCVPKVPAVLLHGLHAGLSRHPCCASACRVAFFGLVAWRPGGGELRQGAGAGRRAAAGSAGGHAAAQAGGARGGRAHAAVYGQVPAAGLLAAVGGQHAHIACNMRRCAVCDARLLLHRYRADLASRDSQLKKLQDKWFAAEQSRGPGGAVTPGQRDMASAAAWFGDLGWDLASGAAQHMLVLRCVSARQCAADETALLLCQTTATSSWARCSSALRPTRPRPSGCTAFSVSARLRPAPAPTGVPAAAAAAAPARRQWHLPSTGQACPGGERPQQAAHACLSTLICPGILTDVALLRCPPAAWTAWTRRCRRCCKRRRTRLLTLLPRPLPPRSRRRWTARCALQARHLQAVARRRQRLSCGPSPASSSTLSSFYLASLWPTWSSWLPPAAKLSSWQCTGARACRQCTRAMRMHPRMPLISTARCLHACHLQPHRRALRTQQFLEFTAADLAGRHAKQQALWEAFEASRRGKLVSKAELDEFYSRLQVRGWGARRVPPLMCSCDSRRHITSCCTHTGRRRAAQGRPGQGQGGPDRQGGQGAGAAQRCKQRAQQAQQAGQRGARRKVTRHIARMHGIVSRLICRIACRLHVKKTWCL